MIGKRVRRKSDGKWFAVTGQTEAAWVLTPDEFGSPVEVSPETLASEYGVTQVTVPRQADQERAWERLAAGFRDAVLTSRGRPPRALSPEDQFRILSGDEAQARRIADDPDLIADYECALLDVPPEVARRLDELIAKRNAADARRP